MPSTINADNGVVSGSSGVKTTADTSGVLALQSNGSTGLTLDTSLNVGVGVTPSAWRSAYNVTYGERALEVTYSALVTQAGPSTILANNVYFNSSNQWIYKNAVANTNAGLYTIGSDGLHTWSVAPTGASGAVATMTQVLSINKDKSLALQGATAATGTGITFPATQSASSDANTLDDYEEGTWTGTLTGGTTNPSTTVTATGRYTKVGRLVELQISFENVNTTGASGQIRITGLPFTPVSGERVICAPAFFNAATFTGSPIGMIDNNLTTIYFYSNITTSAWSDVTHSAGTSRYISVNGTYTV